MVFFTFLLLFLDNFSACIFGVNFFRRDHLPVSFLHATSFAATKILQQTLPRSIRNPPCMGGDSPLRKPYII